MARKVPTYGRSRDEVYRDIALQEYSADVPLGSTDPTVVWGKMYNQNMPNASRMARGGLRSFQGKYPQGPRTVH